MADVYLSPSSQHFNEGYGEFGTEERRMNLIADVVEYELARNGVSTQRNTPEMSLTEIVADANAKNPQIYVALQSQSADCSMSGAEIFYFKSGGNSYRLASDIFERLTKVTPTEDIGLSDGSVVYGGLGFYELRKTKAPSVIVEVGFHDNPLDADFIIYNTYEIGVAVAMGITDYFGKKFTPDNDENTNKLKQDYNGVIF